MPSKPRGLKPTAETCGESLAGLVTGFVLSQNAYVDLLGGEHTTVYLPPRNDQDAIIGRLFAGLPLTTVEREATTLVELASALTIDFLAVAVDLEQLATRRFRLRSAEDTISMKEKILSSP